MKLTEAKYELTNRKMYYDASGIIKLTNGSFVWYLEGKKFGVFEYAWFNCYTWSKQDVINGKNAEKTREFIKRVPGIMCHYYDLSSEHLEQRRISPYHNDFSGDYALSEKTDYFYSILENDEKSSLCLFSVDFSEIKKRKEMFKGVEDPIEAFLSVQKQILENNGNQTYNIYEVRD